MNRKKFESISAIIVAGGVGKRVGSPTNKTLLPIGNRPVLAWALAPFLEHPGIDEIVLVVHSRDRQTLESGKLQGWTAPDSVQLIDGGSDRPSSVRKGLLATTCNTDDLVLVHDGARPLISTGDIDLVIESARSSCGALLTLPFTETFKEVDDQGRVLRTPDRNRHRLAQTPQAFRREDLIRAYAEAKTRNLIPTDSASAIEIFRTCPRCGSARNFQTEGSETFLSCSQHPQCPEQISMSPSERLNLQRLIEWPIEIAEGRRENFKITTAEDLERAEFLLARNGPRE